MRINYWVNTCCSPIPIACIVACIITVAGCGQQKVDEVDQAHHAEQELEAMSLIVGTYTSANADGTVSTSEGAYSLPFDGSPGLVEPRLVTAIENPSFAAVDSRTNRIYVVSETQAGQVAAYRVSNGVEWDLINTVSSMGAYPCYVSLSPGGRQLAVANYGTGNIAVYNINRSTGELTGQPQVRQHSGTGPNASRQEGPHAHWVEWSRDGRFVYVVDLGIDQVIAYPVDPQSGELGSGFTAMATTPGAGPRHMVFHPSKAFAYMLTELNNTVVMASVQADGRLVAMQTVDTLPEDFDKHSQAAHIAINEQGTSLYASNRGHNSIAVFDVAEDGYLQRVQLVGTEGDWPRHFALLSESLLVANQNSHNLVAFNIDKAGLLSLRGEYAQVSQPVYVGPLVNN